MKGYHHWLENWVLCVVSERGCKFLFYYKVLISQSTIIDEIPDEVIAALRRKILARRSRTKANMNVVVFSLVSLSYLFRNAFSYTCRSSGFSGCECNILGACDIQGNRVTRLDNEFTGYAPMGIRQFQYGQENLAFLCEGKTTTIMYDCNERLPLYSATMMTGNQLNSNYKRSFSSFQFFQI